MIATPLFMGRSLLVRPDGSAVDHLDVTVVCLGNHIHRAVSHARLLPAHDAVVAPRSGAIALKQVAPRRTRPQHLKDTAKQPLIIDTRHAPRLIREKRRDHGPFEIDQNMAAHTAALNQINAAFGIWLMGSQPSALG
jgi:hypothetical protein